MQPAHGTEIQYRFQDVCVDTRAHSVQRAGVELALEPKAYSVLLQLLARPGAVLTRDELLDAVWGHRHVTAAVLNRVIAMLRRELGDEADHPTIIRTVHGVGYALIASVTTAAASERVDVQDEDEDETSVRLPVTEDAAPGDGNTPAIHAQAGEPTARIAAAPGAAAHPERPTKRAWAFSSSRTLAGLTTVAVAILLSWAWWSTHRQRTPAVVATDAPAVIRAAGPTTLAVLPFEVVGHDPALGELASGLTDSLAESLARVAALRVTSADSTAIAVAADPEPRAVARALAVGHVLRGLLRPSGGGDLELELRLHDPGQRAPIWTHVVRNARTQPFRLIGPALDAIAESPLGRPHARAADPALAAALDAQDLYWLGRQHLSRADANSWRRALALFEEATRIDPAYALPFTGASKAHRLLAIAGAEPLEEKAEHALAAVERALALDPNLAQAYIEKAMISTMQWRPIEGRDAARRAMELAPNHPDVLWINGNIENYLGRPRAALALHQRALAGDPLSSLPVMRMGQDYMTLGEEENARAQFAKARSLSIRSPQIDPMQLRMGLAFGRLAEVTSARTDAHVVPSAYAVLHRAQAWSMLGVEAESERALARLATTRSAAPLHIAVGLDARWRRKRWAEALQWGESVGRDITQEPWRTIWIAQARVLAGDAATGLRDYDRMLADPSNRALLTYSWFPTRIGVGQVANWIALRRRAGATYEAELTALRSDMAGMSENGVDSPAFDYHRAVVAALSGETSEADARLGRAISRGWLDEVAFDSDFVWAEFMDAPWLRARRAQLRARIATERTAALAELSRTAATTLPSARAPPARQVATP